MSKPTKPAGELADDLLFGAQSVADFVGLDLRKTYYLIQRGQLPVRKLGHRTIVASKAAIAAALVGGERDEEA